MRHHPVLRVVTKLVIPPIMVFSLYVQFHGDYGPGGGFQGGVIFAASIVLYSLVQGLEQARRVFPEWLLRIGIAAGIFLYAGVGLVCMLLGGNYLDYSVLASDPVAGQHLGILLVELGVGITVASVMVLIFFCFASQDR